MKKNKDIIKNDFFNFRLLIIISKYLEIIITVLYSLYRLIYDWESFDIIGKILIIFLAFTVSIIISIVNNFIKSLIIGFEIIIYNKNTEITKNINVKFPKDK